MWQTLLPHPRDDHITVCRHIVPHHRLVSSTIVLLLAGFPSLRAATIDRKRGSNALTSESLQGYPRASPPSLDCSVTRHVQQKSLLPKVQFPSDQVFLPIFLPHSGGCSLRTLFTACPHCAAKLSRSMDVVPLRRNPASRAGSAGASASRYARQGRGGETSLLRLGLRAINIVPDAVVSTSLRLLRRALQQ